MGVPVANELTMDPGYFERIYSDGDDPWGFESSPYEQRKFDLTLASLPNARYRRVFEPGCSIGVLSERLAQRADELMCLELVPRIAERARFRLARCCHASVSVGTIPDEWPAGSFDLMVFSEVLYYLTAAGLQVSLARARESLALGGHLVAVHYLLETNYPLAGAEVHRQLRQMPWLNEVGSYKESAFELVVFERC